MTPGNARDRLLGAAVQAFAARGFYASTTREIAAAAGLSPAAVYMHFPSKEDLLDDLITSTYAEISGMLRAAKDGAVTAQDALRQMVFVQVHWHATQTTRARVAIDEMRALPAGRYVAIADVREKIRQMFEEVISAGVTAGVFEVEDVGVATSFIASMAGGVGRWDAPEGSAEPEDLAEQYATLALRALRFADRQARRADGQVALPLARGESHALPSDVSAAD